jgi:hypothetical protein
MTDIDLDPGAPDTWDRMLRTFTAELMGPRSGECLTCYVARMLDSFGCDTGLRFATRFRDATAPTATALERRLHRAGAWCDCEIFLNGWWLDQRFWSATSPPAQASATTGATGAPVPLPRCAGVGRGSTQPCSNWVRRDRLGW